MDKNIELWKQMLESQLEEVEPVDDSVEQSQVVIDNAVAKKLNELQGDCKKSKSKFMAERFRVYGYEGQILTSICTNLENIIQSLKSGNISLNMCDCLDSVITDIYYADRHKTPGPTDPRDIR